MSDVYIEKRECGDFAVRLPGSERASAVRKSADDAVSWCREHMRGRTILVERHRETSVGGRDKWKRVN